MENNNNGNCDILQTPLQKRRPKTLGIRYSSIKTMSKTPYSEMRLRNDSIKTLTDETSSPRTPFSVSDNIQTTSKSTGHLPNYKLSLGRKVLRKKRLQFADNSDLKTNITELTVNFVSSSSKMDQKIIDCQTHYKPRVDHATNLENIQNKSVEHCEIIENKNLNIKSDKKDKIPVPVNADTSKTNFILRNLSETNLLVTNENQTSQHVEHTECNSFTKPNLNNETLNMFFDDSENFPVDIIEDENHLQKVAELKRLISIWQEGFKKALDDLKKKLDPPRESIEILELLNIPEHMINYL